MSRRVFNKKARSEKWRCRFSYKENPPYVYAHFDDGQAAADFLSHLQHKDKGGYSRSVGSHRWGGLLASDVLKLLGVETTGFTPKYKRWCRISDDELVARASQFKSRTEWYAGTKGGDYQYVRIYRPHLIEACTAHMGLPGGFRYQNYEVYVYDFGEAAYIGLTGLPKVRHYGHTEKGPVAEWTKAGKIAEFKVIKSGLWALEAGRLEKELIAEYKAAGRAMLNKTGGGELSLRFSLISYGHVLDVASGCKSLGDFLKVSRRLYQAAWRNDWLDALIVDCGWTASPQHKSKAAA